MKQLILAIIKGLVLFFSIGFWWLTIVDTIGGWTGWCIALAGAIIILYVYYKLIDWLEWYDL